MRCRFCTCRVQASPVALTYPDPVCPRPQRGGAGHRWTAVSSPITDYLRLTVKQFWRQPSMGDLSRMPSPVLLRNKALLEELFHTERMQRETFRSFGTVIRLQYQLPTASGHHAEW